MEDPPAAGSYACDISTPIGADGEDDHDHGLLNDDLYKHIIRTSQNILYVRDEILKYRIDDRNDTL